MANKPFNNPVVQQVVSQENGETKETTLEDIETRDGEYRRSFTARHIHIISLGGQIGAGLFISSGKNLRDGGPATLFLAFATVCTCVFAVLNTVSEMTIAFPTSGNYIDYADRFVDPALAFAGGFSMWLGWTAIVAAEATFFSVIINYWAENRVNEAVWYTVFLVIMLVIFALPNTVFAWFEYATSIMKVLALFVFILAGFAMVLGAGPNGYQFCSSVLLAVLAIGDNTFTGFLAGEAKTPRFSIAHAVILIPIRVTVLYLLSMLFIGLLVPATDQRLLGGSGSAASPFVIALAEAGMPGLPELLNVVIMFAVAAIGAESVFVASRILRAMSHQRLIPAWVAHVDRKGRPRWALLITYTSAVALTYCNLSAGGITVFNWLAQIATTGYFMVWVVIGITSFRFRAALKAQDDPLFEQRYAWRCKWWPVPPAWLLLCCSLYTGCSFYMALYPIGSDTPSAYSFFQYMIGTVLILGLGTIYKVVFRTKLRDPEGVDLRTGRRLLSEEEIKMLDDYYGSSKWRRLAAFLQLW
ncbi:uncharacterized protein MYCFIDRAFT_186399 [Pseudocercospora fijiensis CIRAD86]|uniref:Amino acid permease/ SLC12A domain-containing protein n=1 Tax=Pseudocercospora fijiensis (strain CIRAD86) TaxID=383855 RepID=M3B9S8_PSEFD|nr:uncharacterized protein MYCFIDRAFT_186399 [Pseudocercospora fijiensis CIRAD86]EME86013.1 hypothetical protein MYCFIDRAFT_186399 [Pseudocercospora fijiensis CIRAD86]